MLPTIKGRPKDLDVRRPGSPKGLFVRGLGRPGTWKSERPGSPKGLDVRGLERPGTWMSERPGCPGTWMSGDLDVRDLSVRKLSVRELNVREPILEPHARVKLYTHDAILGKCL